MSVIPFPRSRDLSAPASHTPPLTMGKVLGMEESFRLVPDDWKCHMAVLGGTGGGKSKFLELFCSYLLRFHEGGILIDPHGDLADNLMAFVAYRKSRGDDELWRRVHYLEVGPENAFAFDPFAHAPRRGKVSAVEYHDWLSTKVDNVVHALMRRVSEAEQDKMLRLAKWLRNIVFACGVALDGENTHLGLDHAMIFTDPRRPEFEPFLEKVWPFLDADIQADFRTLRETKSEQVRDKLESAINRLRSVFSSSWSVQSVFGQHARSINFADVIRKREFIVANLSRGRYSSLDQKYTVGGLLISEVMEAKLSEEDVPEHLRVPFTMVIDESGEFLGEDLKWALGAMRKFKLSLVLAAQDLSTFAKGDLDVAPKVLSMCGTVVTFRQTYREDQEQIVHRVGTSNIDFTPRVVEVQRQRDWEERWVEEYSHGHKKESGRSEGTSVGDQEADSLQKSKQKGTSTSTSQTVTHQDGEANSSVLGNSGSRTRDHSGRELSNSNTGHWSGSTSQNSSDGVANANSSQETETEGESVGRSLTKSRAANSGVSASEGENFSTSLKLLHYPRIVSEWEVDGTLEAGTIQVQYEKMIQQLHNLGTAEAIVSTLRIRGGFPVKIATVPELWVPEAKASAVAGIKKLVRGLQPYNFSPAEALEADVPQVVVTKVHEVNGNGHAGNGHHGRNGHGNGMPNGRNGNGHHANGNGVAPAASDLME